MSSDGTHVWVTNDNDPGTVSEIDASTGTVVNTIPVGSGPYGVSSDGTHVWVANAGDNTVSEIQISAASTLLQGSPTSSTVADGAGYSGQLTVTNATGTVSYTETASADSSDMVVGSSGAMSAAATLAPGVYTVSGTDSDTSGDSGTWTFTLTVQGATLIQGPPTSATVADGAGYSGQLAVAKSTGTVSYTETASADSSDVVVGSSGAVTAAATLAPGVYTVSGSDSDTAGDSGTWTFTLTVQATISGYIENRGGPPVASVTVSITGGPAGALPDDQTVTTNSDGYYSASVDPGSYTVLPEPASGIYVPEDRFECTVVGDACAVQVTTSSATADFQTALAVDSITFEQQGPTGGSLTAVPANGTYDGNIVDVEATVSNISATPQSTDVSFTDSGQNLTPASGTPAGKGPVQDDVTVPANSTLTVSMDWDTSGQAWTSAVVPASQHTIEVDLVGTNESLSKPIFVNPKPVMLVHGWASDYTTWASYLGLFGWVHKANPDWHAYAVGDGQAPGVMNTAPFGNSNTITQNAAILARYIAAVRQQTGAWHVDIVAHSMGGLISRQYIQLLMPANPPDGRPVVTHLVMLGTPNQGSVCADALIAVNLVARFELGARHYSIATWQLTPEYMQQFNATVTQTRGVQFSILAGTGIPLCVVGAVGPPVLSPPTTSDGVVPVASALWDGIPFQYERTDFGLLHTSIDLVVFGLLLLGGASAGGGICANRRRQPAAEGVTDRHGGHERRD